MCAAISPLLIGAAAWGETARPPLLAPSVVWTCRARRHVAFPPPAAIAVLFFPSWEGGGSHREGDGLRVPRGRYGSAPACGLLPPRGFVRPAAHAARWEQAQARPLPAVCRALSPFFCLGLAELRATASGTSTGAHRMNA
jgi:hypothetical protein